MLTGELAGTPIILANWNSHDMMMEVLYGASRAPSKHWTELTLVG